MRNFIIILAFFFSFLNVNAQKEKLDQLFEKYQETDGVTSIKIAKPMFSMLNKLNIDDAGLEQIQPLLSKINGLKILVLEKPVADPDRKQNGLFQKLQSDISNSIKNMKYEELMTVNSKDSKIKFLSSDATNGILDNLLLSVSSKDNTVLMMLDGKISMDDVNNLVNEAQNSSPITSVVTENISSNSTKQVRHVGKFSGVSVSNGIKVNFTQGNKQTVVVETEPNLQQYISTEVENGILIIKVNTKNQRSLHFRNLLVTIEAPQLQSVKLNSGSLLTTLNTVREENFTADLSSGSNLNANLNIKDKTQVEITSGSSMKIEVDTKNFELEGTSGSMATVNGVSENASFKLTSAATCNAQNLVSKFGSGVATSGSSLKIQATETLSAVTSSGGSIRYVGKPKTMSSSNTSGGSTKPL